jgi:hypothetical protein
LAVILTKVDTPMLADLRDTQQWRRELGEKTNERFAHSRAPAMGTLPNLANARFTAVKTCACVSQPSAHIGTPSNNQESMMENTTEQAQHAPWNKSVIVGQKVTVQIERDLGHSSAPSIATPGSGTRHVRPGARQ